ncbi:type II secretion system protein [Candidatus Woesebacteria bacterium]|nr:type II secretion system protein [Candidatus Woesebacteria bacterium]QQG47943.1 MAG: type II secretion system protein [Candidatus Woesebacteria bacterium]
MKKKYKNSGFTLIELSIGLTVMVVIGVAIAGLQYIISKSQVAVYNGSLKVEYANSNVSALVREIRTSRNGDNGAYVIESATNTSLTFYSDIDADGKTERVRYFMNGTSLMKGVIKPSGNPITYPPANEQLRSVADSIQNGATPVFSYYNKNWPTDAINNPMSSPVNLSAIRMVKIYLRVNTITNDSIHDYVMDSAAMIRTLKDNL